MKETPKTRTRMISTPMIAFFISIFLGSNDCIRLPDVANTGTGPEIEHPALFNVWSLAVWLGWAMLIIAVDCRFRDLDV
jgi:hypothetical protein